jgi:hypothetical protein
MPRKAIATTHGYRDLEKSVTQRDPGREVLIAALINYIIL